MEQINDFHTHIGQYFNTYYDYHEVFNALRDNSVTEITCAYFTPRFDNQNNAIEFYFAVVEELKKAYEYGNQIGVKTNFLYWADPLVLKNRSLDEIFSDYDYSGIAIHPRLHFWTKEFSKDLTKILKFCRLKSIPLFIHTGDDELDEPLQFEPFIADFSDVEIHLAHCKATDAIIYLFQKYPNLYGDTAFCPYESYKAICDAGFKNKMLFGTDFPITHWVKKREKTEEYVAEEILTKEYTESLLTNSFYHKD